MINEVQEVQEYLSGENIFKKECTFRMCFLLAKYFKEQKLSPLEIRKKIFNWAYEFNIYIKHNVNDVIRMVIDEDSHLFEEPIYISKEDIDNIKIRFDSKNSRLCALGMLLYAKAYADEDGKFNFNQTDFAKWVGIQQPHVSEYIDELETFDYLDKIYLNGEQTFAWNGRLVGKRIRYKLKVPYKNEGEIFVKDNDIVSLFKEIF